MKGTHVQRDADWNLTSLAACRKIWKHFPSSIMKGALLALKSLPHRAQLTTGSRTFILEPIASNFGL